MLSEAVYESIGIMPMPVNFRHAEVFRRGRPRHGKPGKLSTYDAFYIKHPPMDTVRRAKLFSSFDALKGFGDCIASKEVLYEERHELTEEERGELDRRLDPPEPDRFRPPCKAEQSGSEDYPLCALYRSGI